MNYFISILVVLLLPFAALSHESRSHYEGNENCREFTKEVRVRGKKKYLSGVECQQYDGSWEVVSEEHFDKRDTSYHPHYSRKVYVPSYGLHINLGKRYAYSRPHYNKYYSYGNKWRGGKSLKYLQKKHSYKSKYKKRRGNSYSHLVTKSRTGKK